MAVALSADQIAALAPDPASASAGKKLAVARSWQHLGQNDLAVWGECQGSALYQVRIDLSNYGSKCSCPSRKFPCKHALGLLLLATNTPDAVPTGDPPEWIASWLEKRTATAEKREEKSEKAQQTTGAVATVEQEKRAAKRQALVLQGLDALDLWMNDMVRAGLAVVEQESAQYWEHQAKRLVDAQAPGVATLLRQMGSIPGATQDWPRRLLDQLGRVALLTQAYRHLDALDPAVQDDVRQLIGWNIAQDDVSARGELVEDDWLIVGQWVEEDDSRPNMLVQRTWLVGTHSRRSAMILQFSVLRAPYKESIVPGVQLHGAVRFYPGNSPVRAIIETRMSESTAIKALPGVASIATFLQQQAQLLAQQPWQRWRLGLLERVVPCCTDNGARWWVQDSDNHVLPLHGTDHWKLLALAGGAPVDMAGEWDGEQLQPLGALIGQHYGLL